MLKAYIDELAAGRLTGSRCPACGAVEFPPVERCAACGGRAPEPVALEGTATLRTFTVCRVAPEGMTAPYIVAMAELPEGPWVIGNLVGLEPDKADMGLIGRAVRLGSREAAYQSYAVEPCRVLTFELI